MPFPESQNKIPRIGTAYGRSPKAGVVVEESFPSNGLENEEGSGESGSRSVMEWLFDCYTLSKMQKIDKWVLPATLGLLAILIYAPLIGWGLPDPTVRYWPKPFAIHDIAGHAAL